MGKAEFRVYDSLAKINRLDWERVFGGLPEGYEFYRAVEESRLAEFSFYYATLYLEGRLSLIAPLFVSDFNLDIAVEGFLKKIITAIRRIFPRFLVIKSLFCGSPFAEEGVIGLAKDNPAGPVILEELADALRAFSQEQGARLIIFKDFPQEKAGLLSVLLNKGFFRVDSFPSAVNELDFSSLEDYIKSLGASTRKSLRRKLKSAYRQAEIKVKVLDKADSVIEDLYGLYLNTHYQGATKFERLTKEFFISVGRHMQPNFKVFLYYINGRLGAFNLCFVYKDLFIDKFIGFDYDSSSRYHLYFVSYCYNIDYCIKNAIRFYRTGQTDYCAKIRLGSRLVPLYAYFRHSNKGLNILLKLLSLALKPDNFDSDIRDSVKK